MGKTSETEKTPNQLSLEETIALAKQVQWWDVGAFSENINHIRVRHLQDFSYTIDLHKADEHLNPSVLHTNQDNAALLPSEHNP